MHLLVADHVQLTAAAMHLAYQAACAAAVASLCIISGTMQAHHY
jgi:hypothetical protein